MKRRNYHKGFTLLELIVVIIIIGVLTALALPRLFAAVEGARATEALAAIASIRSAMDRCYLMRNGTYAGCAIFPAFGVNTLDIEDPGLSPGSHFEYIAQNWYVDRPQTYWIYATRNTRDGGDTTRKIRMGYNCFVWISEGGISSSSACNPEHKGKIFWSANSPYKNYIPKGAEL